MQRLNAPKKTKTPPMMTAEQKELSNRVFRDQLKALSLTDRIRSSPEGSNSATGEITRETLKR